jgi:uncharacterized protein
MAKLRVLLVTKGHPFARNEFFSVFDANPDIEWTHVEHPAATRLLALAHADLFDVVVAYDMPGIAFTRSDPPARFDEPPASFVDSFTELLDAGTHGFVFLHHAIAGWPAWPEYAAIVGGRFHYQPALLQGQGYPDSGYRHDVTHLVGVVDQEHPIVAGVPGQFEITDEVYCCPVFEDAVEPLLRSDLVTESASFYSADHAIRGRRNVTDGWSHPLASQLVGWVKHAGNSPVAYLQFGDGPGTYADPNYRLLLANAIAWAGSGEARNWARARRDERGSFA